MTRSIEDWDEPERGHKAADRLMAEALGPGDPDCPFCHGSGWVTDSVDWWGATVPMKTGCECVDEEEVEA